jgi:D-glycero-D-manno-heptose 1,7-bisphosphate phosphatase
MGKHEVARRAVFLDRDGVINRVAVRNGTPHPPSDVEEFELYDDVPDGCARLKAANFLLVVITNQPDVGRGTQSRETVEAMNLKMQSALPLLDRIEICYHAGGRYGQPCDCRKPRPGLILRASAELNIDPKKELCHRRSLARCRLRARRRLSRDFHPARLQRKLARSA